MFGGITNFHSQLRIRNFILVMKLFNTCDPLVQKLFTPLLLFFVVSCAQKTKVKRGAMEGGRAGWAGARAI